MFFAAILRVVAILRSVQTFQLTFLRPSNLLDQELDFTRIIVLS